MSEMQTIQWFPGHMTKTKRQIQSSLKLVDAVAEIIDARIPVSSRNPDLAKLVQNKPRVILLNKCDMANQTATKMWIDYFKKQNLVSVVVVCLIFLFRLVDVEGRSMNNTLATNDKVIVTNLFYTPQNNDIVVISHGAEYNSPIIKRVIAVAGQTVKVDYDNDQIIVDGVVLDEPYIEGSTYGNNIGDNEIPEVIPEGKIFVMGDNRKDSMDSRSTKIGLIDVDDVIGKAQFVVYPFDHFGYLY